MRTSLCEESARGICLAESMALIGLGDLVMLGENHRGKSLTSFSLKTQVADIHN